MSLAFSLKLIIHTLQVNTTEVLTKDLEKSDTTIFLIVFRFLMGSLQLVKSCKKR